MLFLLTEVNVIRMLSAKNIYIRGNSLSCVEANTGTFCVSICAYCLVLLLRANVSVAAATIGTFSNAEE